MNIAKYSLDNKYVIHMIMIFVFVLGIVGYNTLGKKEDAPFVIKIAVLTTQYPGATPEEVEELITEVIEREVQGARGVEFLRSESYYGMSKIFVNMYEYYKNDDMPQLWDELRRKVKSAEAKLPPGASRVDINDDFGDVFGLYFAVVAEDGYTYSELRDYANFIKKMLVPITGVSKVSLFGEQREVVNIMISQERLSNLGISPNLISQALQSQNVLINTGDLRAGDLQLKIKAEGDFRNVEDIGNVIINGPNNKQFRLGDISTITKGYLDPPITKMRFNGKPAIGMGISTPIDANVVAVGKLVQEQLRIVQGQIPIGIEIEGIYFEDQIADEANANFILNLIISIVIVVALLMLTMGVRAGILIGTSLLFAILGTLMVMIFINESLHRTSLAAFIIAMGILVDNAIVVTDNAMVAMKKGVPIKKALIDGATIPQWGLLGATIIAISSFLPLYLAGSNAAEVIKPLFIVLAISLFLSWIFALSQTTVYGEFLLKVKPEQGKDPYDNKFYNWFDKFLGTILAKPFMTIAIIVGIFILSLAAFNQTKRSFFPAINKPYFKVDYWLQTGTSIYKTEADIKIIEDYLLSRDDVKQVSVTLGASPLRYYLASTSFGPLPNFANILVETKKPEDSGLVQTELGEFIKENLPGALPVLQNFKVSPLPDAEIEVMFKGPDANVLRGLAKQAKEIMRKEPLAHNVRDSWGEKIPVWEPIYSQNRGQLLGVTKESMAFSMRTITNGVPVGDYREKDKSITILMKDENFGHINLANMGNIPVFSNSGSAVLLNQVTERQDFDWKNFVIKRFDRQRGLSAQCDPLPGIESPELEAKLFPLMEQIELPDGYSMMYDGMYRMQARTQGAIAEKLPIMVFIILMILTVLFNSFKKPILIMLTVPFIMIGITGALLITGTPFGFFAILGVLGLIGMVIKNAIVLIDQVNLELAEGNSQYDSIKTATRSRVMPVSMAAGTTILGMMPLLPDPMFGGMAASIMGGLFAATLLTIIVVPALYVVFYKVKPPKK
ncbi:efflux RND transporter permease subunit [Flexithrix dorotheae]|uniref:efflux RND transporter permease subunit n=1 Tax=Flexithrix dorotheae TaxID=70993 RepID=UPI000380A657|nr:efflux RND transporter permease subunit [Flexithrix dorotheae]